MRQAVSPCTWPAPCAQGSGSGNAWTVSCLLQRMGGSAGSPCAGHPSSVTLRSRAGRGFDSAWHNLRLWVAITRGYVPAQDCWGTPGGDLCMVKRDRHPGRVGMLRNAARKCAALFAGCLLTLSLAVSAQTRQLLNYEAIHKPAAGTA